MLLHRLTVVAITCLAATPLATAAPIGAGIFELRINAVQDITLPANSPFNPTANARLIPDVSAIGMFRFNRQAQATVNGDIELTDGEFLGLGIDSRIFGVASEYKLFSGLAEGGTNPLTATLTNVQQDPLDTTGDTASLISANGLFNVPDFGFEFLTGPAAGGQLEIIQPFQFSVTFDGLPPSDGTVFTSTDTPLDGLVVGAPMPTIGAVSSNRRLFVTAIPEPGAFAMIGAVGAGWLIRRRRKV